MTTLSTTRTLIAAAGLATMVVAGLTTEAAATSEASTAACSQLIGQVTAAGHHGSTKVTATKPPTATGTIEPDQLFAPGSVRLAARMTEVGELPHFGVRAGHAVIGDSLYSYKYVMDRSTGHIDRPPALTRIGSGWGNYKAVETSTYSDASSSRSHGYGLSQNGVLTRWTLSGGTWRSPASFSGLSNVKAMALISKTRTYDTFLITRTTGALQTIRIPVTAPLKPVIKTVRATTWQGFEAMIATGCGNSGTLLTAIDKDTKSAHLYAFSRANGTSTVIQSIGRVPASFTAPTYFHWGHPDERLVGE